MAQWVINTEIDMAKGRSAGARQQSIQLLAYPGNAAAHGWRVTVRENGYPYIMSGHTITAYLQRADGNTVLVQGTANGNVAQVVFPAEVYAVPGVVHGIINATVSGQSTTALDAVSFTVRPNLTGNIIDPGSVIPASIDDMLAIIGDAQEAATNAANATKYIADTYDATKTYAVGGYVIHNGKMYRCNTTISTAEAWTAAHWTETQVGDDVGELKTALNNMEDAIYVTKEVETPYIADVDMLIETEVDQSGYVVSGTRNKGTLYPLKQGTFNVNGLNIVVDKNKITIDGTTTSAMYFDFKTGEALPVGSASTAQLAGTEWSLPSRTWYISYGALTGYQNPVGLSFRKKDNSGNISLNYAPITYDSSTMGGLCAYYSNGTEVHRGCYFNIVDIDTRDYASQKAERVEWITTNTRVEANSGDCILADANSTVYGLYNRNIHKKTKFVYSNSAVPNSGSNIGIHIYIPMKEGYVDYIFVNSKRAVGSASQGACDVWRLNQIAKVNDLYIHQYYITALGETEMAIKVKYPVGEGESIPFLGGYTHGWEIVNSGSFFAALNGKYVDITQYTNLTEFDTLEFFSTSTLYHPSKGDEIGQHGVKWTFTSEGLEIEQSINFSGNYTMIDSYMTMLCAVRDHFSTESVQVTDTYIDDLTFQQWDVSEPGFQTYPRSFKHDVSKVNLYGKTSGIDIAVEYVSQTHGNDGEGNYLWNGNDYNKLYNAIAGYNLIENQVTASTIWRENSKISIKAN